MRDHQAILLAKQDAAAKAGDRMLEALLGYEPCRDLTVGDVKFISEWARTCAFSAIEMALDAIRQPAAADTPPGPPDPPGPVAARVA